VLFHASLGNDKAQKYNKYFEDRFDGFTKVVKAAKAIAN
jgi:hypothetical protein